MKNFLIVVFGITSNLAKIKLIPALFGLYSKGLVKDVEVIGLSHRERSLGEYKQFIREAIRGKYKDVSGELTKGFIDKFEFASGDVSERSLYGELKEIVDKKGPCKNKIFYLATHPNLYEAILGNIHESGLDNKDGNKIKLMVEKPIGEDLKTARKLNELMARYYSEDQIFRIDHYLAKETIQNIMAFRFGNKIFEPVMSSEYIDHIQIMASETFGAEARNSYYDKVGALKDVGQNHLLQMLVFATMGEPGSFDNQRITLRRLEVLKSLVPLADKLVLGQYEGYTDEGDKKTNTFFALKTILSHGRFKEVPVYIRAGKKLAKNAAEINIVFKNEGKKKNVLVFRIQPNEGIVLKLLVKKPGMGLALDEGLMQFCYKSLSNNLINPYEKLIFDALNEDQTFFNDAAEVEAQWKFIDALESEKVAVNSYKSGSWGPKEADKLIKQDGREWIEPADIYCNV